MSNESDDEYPWAFTRTYEPSIPSNAKDEHIVDIRLDSDYLEWRVEAFTYNSNTDTFLVRCHENINHFRLCIFHKSGQDEYQELREIGKTGQTKEFRNYLRAEVVSPEPDVKHIRTFEIFQRHNIN